MGKYIPYNKEKLIEIAHKEREKGKKIVLTGGCFDLVHEGHIYLLKKAKSLGDILFVNIINDERVKFHKGEERPIRPEIRRARVLANIDYVDYTTIHPSTEEGPTTELARIIKPDILVQSEGKWKKEDEKRLHELLGYEIILESVPYSPYNISTTEIIKSILKKAG